MASNGKIFYLSLYLQLLDKLFDLNTLQ